MKFLTSSTSILSFFSINYTSSMISPLGHKRRRPILASGLIPNLDRILSQKDPIVSFAWSTCIRTGQRFSAPLIHIETRISIEEEFFTEVVLI